MIIFIFFNLFYTQIFNTFFRGNNAKKFKGKGIGMSIVKKIIELHHGTIQIITELNKGTEVIIKLPK